MSGTVLFDGVCNLCNSSVTFILRRDPKKFFRFAALQSPTGRSLAEKFGVVLREPPASILLVEAEKVYSESTAALRIARRLSGLWPLFYGAIIIPRPLRDALYRWIAKNRYRWFGKKDTCMIPSPELRSRFLP
ncbi:MAG TPA: thiol-disulfide oxidoreductase [Deltaproteobacteria bacterium]|nr:thiol-disulfide oxidoreductase [Deltaproteobacteria bacterium]